MGLNKGFKELIGCKNLIHHAKKLNLGQKILAWELLTCVNLTAPLKKMSNMYMGVSSKFNYFFIFKFFKHEIVNH